MHLDAVSKLKIIKSTKGKGDIAFKEVIYYECLDSNELLTRMKTIENHYKSNANYETLHVLKDFMSLKFRKLDTDEEVLFYAAE